MAEGLKQRVTTAILFGIPVLGLLFYNDATRVVFISLLLILTAFEYLQLHYKPLSKHFPQVLISMAMAVGLGFLAYQSLIPEKFLLGIGVAVGLVYLIDLLVSEQKWLRGQAWLMTVFYTAIPFSLLLREHVSPHFSSLLIGTLLLIWVSDSGAYFVGKSIGKRKLMPSISPGKSWEGFWGAGMCTMIASYLFSSLMGVFSFRTWALMALSVWIFGSLGDLVESKLKRKLNIKDSGTILPGHGGFLDRFDGFYFCLPFVILAIKLTHTT